MNPDPGTTLARTWTRLRKSLQVIAEAGPMAAGELWMLTIAAVPENDYERERGSGTQSRGRKFWQLQSINLTKAGWLDKSAGTWRITEAGKAALGDYPDDATLRARAADLYGEWAANRHEGGRRAWLVRPRQGGGALVQRWMAEGLVSLAATHLGELPAGADQQSVREAVESGYQHLDYAQRVSLTNEYLAFLSRMDIDDIVATIVDDRLSVGVVTGEAEFDPGAEGARLRRTVEWHGAAPRAIDSLPAPLPSDLEQQGTLVDLTNALDAFAALLRSDPPASALASQTTPPLPVGPPRLRSVTGDLAASVYLDQAWLQEVVDLLADRSQIVLYGPPGTGKTYLAQAIARHLSDRDAVRLVQFHPSYAYEDFFEGFRPVESPDGSSVGFAKTPGPLRELAAEAKANPERPHVLIVDEINRANLAKVFGELYFLLEYRNAAIRLQYSPSEAFSLPPNIFLIGTMNTADRSIALVDAAIRRRFAFVELHPDDPPVRDVLARWLAANRQDGVRADLLRTLNDAIGEEDRDFKIGPSYLMRSHIDQPGGLERVWRHDLLPLLEDHYYGRLTRNQVRDRFGLEAIRRRLIVGSETMGPASQ
jgi:5-methylcytosine-specific restriction protein B